QFAELPSFKQQLLGALRPAKRRRRELWSVSADAGLSARHLKHVIDHVREDPFAPHARAEASVVEAAAAQRANPAEHFLFLLGVMLLQPLLEKRRDGIWQAERDVTFRACAGLGGCCQDPRHPMISQSWNDPRHHPPSPHSPAR